MPASPIVASGAITISSQAMATSTACPLSAAGMYATVLTALASRLDRKCASDSERPKSLPWPFWFCVEANSNTSTAAGAAAGHLGQIAFWTA